jgi:signal transduction histidine kinase
MRWGDRSLRIRLTVLATLVAAAGLVVGAILMVVLLRHSLTSSLDDGARRTGQQVAGMGVPPPDPIPVGGGNIVVVQVVNPQDRVIGAAGATADHLFPLLQPNELAQVRAGRVLRLDGERAGVTGSLRVVGVPAGSGGDRATVVVAVDPSGIGESTQVLRGQLFIFVPVLVLALALLSYFVIGRALGPVEDLRRGAAEISGAAQTGGDAATRRLPVPAGRDEVHRLALTLNDMLTRLDAASSRQRAFIADAAHELRSPLASLRTQLEVAQHLGARADWPRTADGALIDIDRLSRLVDDLLLLARLDESAGVRRSVVDLPELVAEVASGYEHARVPVQVTSEGSGLVEGDADGLRRVVRNLLDNAIRHAAGQVSVHTSGSSRRVVLTVTDDGPGIAQADRERVFDRFTRLDDARSRDAGGSGLGLAIVRDLVRAHGGTVALGEASPGLRVTVRLPVAGTPATVDVPPQLAGEPQRRPY